jgi:F-type H+-transporting ATPase subunit alpha
MNLSKELTGLLEQKITSYRKEAKQEHVGTVVEIGDGIAKIDGLSNIGSAEMIDFGNGVYGTALNLNKDLVGAIILGTRQSEVCFWSQG